MKVGGSHNFEYCPRCYLTASRNLGYSFGLCKSCWVKHGSPKAVEA